MAIARKYRAGLVCWLVVMALTGLLCLTSCTKETPGTAVERTSADQAPSGPVLCAAGETKCGKLANYCLNGEDNILACDSAGNCIRVISPDDKLVAKWALDFAPEAIDCRPDGTTIAAGAGKIALLDQQGKVTRQGELPGTASSGVGFSGADIFVAVRVNTGYSVYRLDDTLANPAMIITDLRGCCGQMDITSKEGVVYVAANCLFKVIKYDREGKELARFGEVGQSGANTFKGCCEPKNLCFDSDGNLYTSESNDCCVKKFSTDGKFIAPVGTFKGITGCVRVTIGVTKDKSRVYMLDTGKNVIRILELPKVAQAI